MTTITDKLAQINTLRAQIEAHGKLPIEVLRRIEYRFRLECNYYSNRQEGGTLTRQETRTVMIGSITVQGKPLKDIREMQGHDMAMTEILRIGRGEANLSEKRILEIHRAIIVEDDPEKQAQVGQWKTDYNEIITPKGEKFGFLPPDEVPEAIHKLLDWLKAELEKTTRNDKNAIHPTVLAFEFHHRFLTIHPFYDGNGRTARLLSNLVLVAHGYPPFFVTDDEKGTYNLYLAEIQGYGASPDLFVDFMLGLLLRSLNLVLDVIEGRDTEQDGWEKELSLLKTTLAGGPDVKVARSTKALLQMSEQSLSPLLTLLFNRLSEFDDLFARKEVELFFDTSGKSVKNVADILSLWKGKLANPSAIPHRISIHYRLLGFSKGGTNTFQVGFQLAFQLDEFKYTVQLELARTEFQLPKLYDQFYTSEETGTIVARCADELLTQIKNNLQQNDFKP